MIGPYDLFSGPQSWDFPINGPHKFILNVHFPAKNSSSELDIPLPYAFIPSPKVSPTLFSLLVKQKYTKNRVSIDPHHSSHHSRNQWPIHP